jgi:photosystem II stability/assembly factor-like uncharacterized protein
MRVKRTSILLVAVTSGAIGLAMAQWVESDGPAGGTVASFAFLEGNVFAGNPTGVYRSTDSGASWGAASEGMTDVAVWSVVAHGRFLFAGTNDGGVFRTDNAGLKWIPVNQGLSDTHVRALSTDGVYVYAGTLGGVFRTSDNGESWTTSSTGMTNDYVRALACSSGKLYAGTLGGGIYVSADSGITWSERNFDLTNTSVMSIAISESRLFAGTYGGLFMSTNDGARWVQVNPTGSNPFPRTSEGVFSSNEVLIPKTVFTLAAYGARVFVGMMEKGVYTTTDGGEDWTPLNAGLTSLSLYSIFISPSYLYVGVYGGGVGRCPLEGVVSSFSEAPPCVPESIVLEQNYPNPFNGISNFGFSISNFSHVTLKVFDLLGREVALLVNERKEPGTYTVTWDASGFATGTYLYRLEAGSVVHSRRMILMR